MATDCWCTPKYVCLSCEKAEKGTTIIRRRRPSEIRKVAVCGTRAGYNKHLRLGEPTCAECRQAHTTSVKNFKKANTHATTAE